MGSIAARARNDESQEMDCLRRARSIGINAGFLDGLLRTRASRTSEVPSGDPSDTQAEAIWNRLEHWGWHGPAFAVRLNEMINGLSSLVSATKYHIGLERLGECLGAESIRPTGQGVPDAVWVFADKAFTLEAKTEKGAETSLSKKEVQQAKGHPDWLRAERPELDNKTISAVVVSSINRIDAAAKPHASGLMHVSADSMAKLGKEVADSLKELRAEFAGKEFAAVLKKFKTRLKECKLHLDLIYEHLSKPLNRS